MEYIKITKIDNVILYKKGTPIIGTLHLTTHHLIFTSNDLNKEFWVPYPLISSVFKNQGSVLLSRYKDLDDWIHHQLPYSLTRKQSQLQKKIINWYTNIDLWSIINIKFITKDYTVFSIDFPIVPDPQINLGNDAYESIMNLTLCNSIEQLYAFLYTPNDLEMSLKDTSYQLYDLIKEFDRQGLNLQSQDCSWRITTINKDYKLTPTYPNKLIVPKSIPDTLLNHCSKYRSKGRFPTLSYYYKRHGNSITRSSQPMPGITKQRSIQDEKLISTIFGINKHNIIVDARPLTNAIAQVALGGGTELMENYNFNQSTKRLFLGIDNIHVMSETNNSLIDNFLIDSDIFPDLSLKINGKFQNWIKYNKLILSSVDKLSKEMIFNKANILVHCSDGWDRTTQIISLVQLCIDPYFRTFKGFMVLIEKDWVCFGHKFRERSNHFSATDCFHDNTTSIFNTQLTLNDNPFTKLRSSKINNFEQNITNQPSATPKSAKSQNVSKSSKFASPIFQQFIDCVFQLQQQNPENFEFNERFLRRLVYHVYACQYGTFLFNSQMEATQHDSGHKTRSVWDHFISKKSLFINKNYNSQNEQTPDEDWISPDLSEVKWWAQLYGRKSEEMETLTEEKGTTIKAAQNGDVTTNGLVESTKELFSFFSLDGFKNYRTSTSQNTSSEA
ncbi:hypothetical protein C6P45_004143 [Maudiozyma exigua]|uniref:Myotubularin phosphatase domain-containing protein n=1 Tax=Maudiozyma exigua TaxID=34358 RepID=A0A9P6WD29_MAUEX|nr:hypothetical protein C6P45_004143 [Kazachstania exigua]